MEAASRAGDVDSVITALARLIGPVSESGDMLIDLAEAPAVAQWS
jgi:hypothetical protein